MTCIIGIKRKGHTWIGADGIGVDPSSGGILYTATPKVWKHGPFIFGSSGSFRAIQIIQGFLYEEDVIGKHKSRGNVPLRDFMIRYMVPAVKKLLEKHSFSEKQDEKSSQGADFLVGVKGCLFLLQDDYAVLSVASPFYCIGSGGSVATGAVEALIQNKRLTPEMVIEKAVTITEKHIANVGPFSKIVSTKDGEQM